MTTPRTIAGQAALSGMRPHLRRALAHTVLAIEAEAIAPYQEALREADRVLQDIANRDVSAAWDVAAAADLAQRAGAARQLLRPLLGQDRGEGR
jgi:hypothetical protein